MSPVEVNTKPATIEGNLICLWSTMFDVMLSDLKDQYNQIKSHLNHRDTRIVESINVCQWTHMGTSDSPI